MICKNCGADIPNDTVFCPVCGTSQDLVENNDTNKAATSYNSTPILVLGILSLVFVEFFGIPGIILGALAKSRAKRMVSEVGKLDGKAIAGKITGTIGFILGIVLTAFYAITIILVIAGVAAGLSLGIFDELLETAEMILH